MALKRHVFFAVPAYSAQIWVQTQRCLYRDFLALGEQGIQVTYEPIMLNPMIAYVRSMYIAMFLSSDATDLVFIDSDMAWEAGEMERLLEHQVDIVGVDYPKRMMPITYSSRLLSVNGAWQTEPNEDGLLRVESLPNGFVRITRRAVERLVNGYPELMFSDPLVPGGKSWALFLQILENQRLWSEDHSFFKRWRDLGGAVYVDTEIKAYHLGTWTFAGDYNEWLKAAAALPQDPN